jgi:hypothetical protein
VIIVLSSAVYYERDGNPTTDPALKKNQTDAFVQIIPYKNLFIKDYTFDGQLKLIALNKDFYEPVIRIFEKHHFNVIAILPIFVLDFLHLVLTEYSAKEADEIYRKLKLILPFSLISAVDIDKSMVVQVYHPQENKKRTIILISFFSLLFVVLLFLIFVRPILQKQSYSQQLQKNMAALPTGNPVQPTKPPELTPTPQPILLDNIRIKVVNSSGVTNQASKIKTALIDAGFKEITTASSAKIVGDKSQLNYTASVPSEVVQKLTTSLEPIIGEVTVNQVESLDNADITVTTGLNSSQ